MRSQLSATDDFVSRYFDLFVNRRAYTHQSFVPDSKNGRCCYYRPKGQVSISDLDD
jgi:hypothetical protein